MVRKEPVRHAGRVARSAPERPASARARPRRARPRTDRAVRALAAALLCLVALLAQRDLPRAEVSWAQEVRARVFKLLNDGIQAYKEGRQKEAIPMLREASDIALNSYRAYYYLGLALKADRQYQKAIEPLQVALELDPASLQARIALGDCQLKLGDRAEALAEYHRALARQDDYAPAYDGLGRAADSAGETEKAIEHFRKAIELNPGFPDASLNLGDLYMNDGRYNEAIELFLAAIKVRPDFAAAFNRLGTAYSRQRLGNLAIAALRQAETLERGNPWHPVSIGGVFQGLDNLVQAGREYDKALKLDPDYLEGYLAKAGLLRRQGKLAEAAEVLDLGLRRDVDDASGRAKIQEMKERVARESQKLAELEPRAQSEQRTPADLAALAELKAGMGDHASAALLLQQAVDLSGEAAGPVLLDRLGYSCLRAGLYREAAGAYATLVAGAPGDADAFINLGLARTGLGDAPGAETALREAVRLRPGDPRPLTYLGNLYVASGQPQKAIESLNASLALMEEGAVERQRVELLLKALGGAKADGT